MRIVPALLAALLAVGVPRMARAADPEPPPPPRIGIEMTYTRNPGAEGCAKRGTMEELLIGRYRYDPFDLKREEVHIVVEITLWQQKNGVYRGRYTIAPPGEDAVAGEETTGGTCTEVLRDIASAIMYDTYLRYPAPKPAPPPELPAPAPAPLPPPAPATPPPAPAAALPRRPTEDKPKPPLSPWVVSVEPSIAFGLVPGIGLGGAVNLTRRWERYSVGVSASWFATIGHERVVGYDVRGSSIDGTIIPCRFVNGTLWTSSLSLCTPIGFGFQALSISSTVMSANPRVASPEAYSLGIGGRLQVEKALTSRIFLGGFGGLSIRVWSRTVSSAPPEGYVDARQPPDGYVRFARAATPVGMLGLYVGAHL